MFHATFRVARLILQTRKLWLVSRLTVTRVTFDLPECKEFFQKKKKKRKETQEKTGTMKNIVFFFSKNHQNQKTRTSKKGEKKKGPARRGTSRDGSTFFSRNVLRNREAIGVKNMKKQKIKLHFTSQNREHKNEKILVSTLCKRLTTGRLLQ